MIQFEDELHTVYIDGTEEARFTPEEWAMMMVDPAATTRRGARTAATAASGVPSTARRTSDGT
jgi:hypothetical protein